MSQNLRKLALAEWVWSVLRMQTIFAEIPGELWERMERWIPQRKAKNPKWGGWPRLIIGAVVDLDVELDLDGNGDTHGF